MWMILCVDHRCYEAKETQTPRCIDIYYGWSLAQSELLGTYAFVVLLLSKTKSIVVFKKAFVDTY